MSQSSCAGPALRHRPQRRATCCPHQTLPLLRKPLCHPGSSFWNHTQAMKALNRPLCKYARPGLCQRAATARPTPPLKKQIKGDCTAESTPLRTVLRRAQHELFIACPPRARSSAAASGAPEFGRLMCAAALACDTRLGSARGGRANTCPAPAKLARRLARPRPARPARHATRTRRLSLGLRRVRTGRAPLPRRPPECLATMHKSSTQNGRGAA